jgi:uncharacterized protein (TIGR02466 family)
MKTNIFKLFSAEIFVKNIGTQEQLTDLIEQSLWYQKNEPYVMRYTNNGCWRSSFKYNNFDWVYDELQGVVEEAMQHYAKDDPTYANKLKQQGELDLQHWTNINEPGSRNVVHSHLAVQYASVFYLQVEGTGDICFYNPANLTENCHATAPWVSVMSYTPKNGDLVVFPGWTPHDIELNKSDKSRISIAFNISFNVQLITDGQEDY